MGKMKRVLIVDDNMMMRRLIRNVFRNEKFDISEAKNGIEGLNLANEHSFDVVITDIVMPEMEGLQFIIELRKIAPQIKIVAISGGKPYYLYMAKKLGIEAVFTKPLNHLEFVNTVKKIAYNHTL
jgi:YesN/AraC family two-component response regulator